MSDNAKIKVTIDDAKRIPGIGKGPIRNPIIITHSRYNVLKVLGFRVNIINDKLEKFDIIDNKDDINETNEEINNIENEESNEDDIDTISLTEESDNEEEVIDDVEDDTEESEDIDEEESVDIDSLTKKEIKAMLDELGVEYRSNANLTELKNLYIENTNSEEE